MYTAFVILLISSCSMVSSVPEFRVLAPQFVCPAAGDTAKGSDQSYITIKATEDLQVTWIVRWKPIAAPAQRFTVALWKTIRQLEKKLNGPPAEHLVYIIKDSELMSGVTYMFNVTGANHEGNTMKSFSIDYSAGDQKLLDIEGRSDRFSLQLLGPQKTYADLGAIIEAQVTTCAHIQDYYFVWTVRDSKSTLTSVTEGGHRLAVPAFVLEPGHHYTVRCEAIKQSNGNVITESILPIQVLYRDLEVFISVDRLVISIGKEFTLYSYISPKNEEQYLKLEWQCFSNNEECIYFDRVNSTTLHFFQGIPIPGEYVITLTVSDLRQSATANTTVIVMKSNLPVIEVAPRYRTVNEGSEVHLVANVSNLTPLCTLAWFVYDDIMSSNRTSDEFPGIISEMETIFSLEQSFLNEIADYTNDTEQREVAASVNAFGGRARIVANCSGGGDDGVSYADVYFEINESPEIGDVMVTPKSGVALETSFRISTTVAEDKHKPIFYSFYCKLRGNDTLLLGSYVDHNAVETYLPYMDPSTEVFVVACDSLDACSSSRGNAVPVRPGGGHMTSILKDLTAHVRRCEMLQLQRLALSAVFTFNNAGQIDKVSILTLKLIDILPSIRLRCVTCEQYREILTTFGNAGININTLLTML